MCNPNGDVLTMLERGGIIGDKGYIGRDAVYLQVHMCVQACIAQMSAQAAVPHDAQTDPAEPTAEARPSREGDAETPQPRKTTPLVKPAGDIEDRAALTPHFKPVKEQQHSGLAMEPLALPMGHQAWKVLQNPAQSAPPTSPMGAPKRSRTPDAPTQRYELGACDVDTAGQIVPLSLKSPARQLRHRARPPSRGSDPENRPPSRGRTRPGQGRSGRPWPGRNRSISPRRDAANQHDEEARRRAARTPETRPTDQS